METWQVDHIKRNLVNLIAYTKCNVQVLAILTAAGVLGDADIDTLRHQSTDSDISMMLYTTLMTRVGSYYVLLEALKITSQTGAAKILEEHGVKYVNYRNIMYDKNHVVGTGKYGTAVYSGEFGGRNVTVKVYNKQLNGGDAAQKEIKFLLKADFHSNIVQYFTAQENVNFVFIVLENWAVSLKAAVLNRRSLDAPSLLKKCTKGMDHLHRNSIFHGNLNPASILITEHDKVKLCDFGCSIQIPVENAPVSSVWTEDRTDWMAPEILKAARNPTVEGTKKWYFRLDVFALGCVFYFTLSRGCHPFGEEDIQYNIKHDKPNLQYSELDEDWLALIKKMISHVPLKRPSTRKMLRNTVLN